MWQLSLRRRRLAGLVVLAVTFAVSDTRAQSPDLQRASVSGPSIAQSGGLGDTGGVPENTIPGTSIPLFRAAWARDIGRILARLKDAAAECDRYAFDAALAAYNEIIHYDPPRVSRQDYARTAWGDVNGDGVADILWGLSTEVQFRPGSVATARSANFPSETYCGTVDPRANMLIMGRVGFAFGRK
jgi:hypothetical protein